MGVSVEEKICAEIMDVEKSDKENMDETTISLDPSLSDEGEIVPDKTETISNISLSVSEEILNISNNSIDNNNANLKHKEHSNEEEQTEPMPKKKQIRIEPKPEIRKHKESVESL